MNNRNGIHIQNTLLLISGVLLFLASCNSSQRKAEIKTEDFIVRDFIPLTNWNYDAEGNQTNDLLISKSIKLDYTGAITSGFIIPTLRQVHSGTFEFGFFIKNTGTAPAKFRYKIYYQNESYKFPEADKIDSTRQNFYAGENFYGSWEDTGITFMETAEVAADNQFHPVTGSFRIVGNPRNEQRYYSNGKNDRWKRNPRVGNYSFMLVVTTENTINNNKLPDGITNISHPVNGDFLNPFFYFLKGEGRSMENTVVLKSPVMLKVIADPDPGAGIYIPPSFFTKEKDGKYFCSTCGQDDSQFSNAPFAQFIHYIDPTTKWYNIPVISDVISGNYSRMDYNWNKQFWRKEELIAVTASTTKAPCQTVSSDAEKHLINIKNPGTEFGKWEKQDVGIITRHGLTYGKWTVRAKLTELLNKNGLWNGLTNAIWLITQAQEEWNLRRSCNKEGYLANYYGGQADKRVPSVAYSEIDFEILKTVPYCPQYLFPPAYNFGTDNQHRMANWNVPFPEEVVADDGNVEVCTTNWDMACWEPDEFSDGCRAVDFGDQTFWAYRWDKGYRAITEKVPEKDDELFGSEYYYFQIDWRPTEIIWRIGPSKDKLRVVGYVNNSVTSIPNNQMVLIISQEFHNTRWWVGSAYDQANIPFPLNDLDGKVYEVTIE
ncbi:MAG: hypothetical protein NTU98_09415 [Bacteroidetes bacterium]|nr:hypothetical protein [Bacteroidota bacterium]